MSVLMAANSRVSLKTEKAIQRVGSKPSRRRRAHPARSRAPAQGAHYVAPPEEHLEAIAQFGQQRRAFAGEIPMSDVASVVTGDDRNIVDRALREFGGPTFSEADMNFLARKLLLKYLIPVASVFEPGAKTWPTIVIPSQENELWCLSDRESDYFLEMLLEMRGYIDRFAAENYCDATGWIGGIWLPHPEPGGGIVVRWPWRHRRYDPNGRRGDQRLLKLFGVSVDRRWY